MVNVYVGSEHYVMPRHLAIPFVTLARSLGERCYSDATSPFVVR